MCGFATLLGVSESGGGSEPSKDDLLVPFLTCLRLAAGFWITSDSSSESDSIYDPLALGNLMPTRCTYDLIIPLVGTMLERLKSAPKLLQKLVESVLHYAVTHRVRGRFV